ncbi:DcrB-related protein [Deinococcus cavernae]|nr:DcrB-related protein [Deinococcus cavernae]
MRYDLETWAALAFLLGVSADAVTFSSPKDGFSITAPAGWKQASYPGTNVVFMAPKPLASFQPNVNVLVQPLPAGITQKKYHDLSLKQLDTVMTDGKILSQRATTLGGQPANEVIYQGRQGKATLYFHATYAVKGRQAYILTGTTVLGSQATLLPAMKTFVSSFKILS